MINQKEQILEVINTLPDDATWDDALYTLYLHSMIEKSEEDYRNCNYITLEELDKEMEEKYARYSITHGKEKHK